MMMYMALWAAVQAAFGLGLRDPKTECELWLGPSTLPGVPGRGVISGTQLLNETALEPLVTLSVPYDAVRYWSLANYVFAHEEEEQSLVVFGIGMLVNHLSDPTMYHYWSEEEPAHSAESYWTPSTMSSSVVYETLRDVKKGEELFISYGGDEWFTDREIPLSKETDRDTETGRCSNHETNTQVYQISNFTIIRKVGKA